VICPSPDFADAAMERKSVVVKPLALKIIPPPEAAIDLKSVTVYDIFSPFVPNA